MIGRRLGAVIVAAAVGLAVGGGAIIHRLSNQPVAAGSANVWVSPTGSDSGANCKRFSPAVTAPANQATWCLSWNKAYQLASCSDTVLLAAGAYATQVLNDNPTVRASCSSSTRVVMKPVAGQTVTVANIPAANNPGFSLDLNAASHLDLENVSGDFTGCSNTGYSFTATGLYIAPPCPAFSMGGSTSTDDIAVNVTFSRLYCSGCTFDSVYNSNFGPSYDWHGIFNSAGTGPTAPRPHDLLVQGTTTHDHYNTAEYKSGCPDDPVTPGACYGNACTSGCDNNQHHIGCGPTQNAAYNVTFNADQWVNCSIDTILIKPFVFGNHDITVENSYVGTCTNTLCNGSKAFDLTCDTAGTSDTTSDYNIKFLGNTILQQGQITTSGAVSCPGSLFVGNIYSGGNCSTGSVGNNMQQEQITLNYTLSTNANCGSSSPNGLTVASYGFAADGIHLAAGSAAIDFVPSATVGVTSSDLDGQTRPCGPAVDAGADEFC